MKLAIEGHDRQLGIEDRIPVLGRGLQGRRHGACARLLRWASPGWLLVGLALLVGGCVTHPKGTHGPACQEIESATHIVEYSTQRLVILKRIAKQRDLSQHEQTYLVNAIFMGGFSDDMADALVNLIGNACYTTQTQQEILKHLRYFRMVGRSHRRVLDEMRKHPEHGEVPKE